MSSFMESSFICCKENISISELFFSQSNLCMLQDLDAYTTIQKLKVLKKKF